MKAASLREDVRRKQTQQDQHGKNTYGKHLRIKIDQKHLRAVKKTCNVGPRRHPEATGNCTRRITKHLFKNIGDEETNRHRQLDYLRFMKVASHL
jgi:hypothetical protein